jgi:hypothetical protein
MVKRGGTGVFQKASQSVAAICGAILFVLATVQPGAVRAQDITPSDVYRSIENINAELAALHEANGSQPLVDQNTPPLTPRFPRHVVQKAREVLLKIELLRVLNGLPENPVPPFPVTEITPANVKAIVDQAHADLLDLRSKFNVTRPVADTPPVTGKSPTDNYAGLQQASSSLDGLGIPKIVPNDVYRLAQVVVDDLEKIRAARGKTDAIDVPTGATGKKPLDTYNRTFEVLEKLKAKVEADPSIKLPGGIVLPNRRTGALTPAHVADLENNLLAELGSVKFAVGVTSPSVLPPAPQGKTPSDTYDILTRALTLVESL